MMANCLPKVLWILFLMLPVLSQAQDAKIFPPSPVKRSINSVKITGNLKVDGRIDESEWALATPTTNFVQIEPLQGENANNLYSIEGRFALNPRLQLIAFYQQNSENNAKNYNIRLSWEYQPLSYVYVVLNRRGFNNVNEPSDIRYEKESHVIAKISYLKQF